MLDISNKNRTENQKRHFVLTIPPPLSPPPENLAIYFTKWKNMVQPNSPHNQTRSEYQVLYLSKLMQTNYFNC